MKSKHVNTQGTFITAVDGIHPQVQYADWSCHSRCWYVSFSIWEIVTQCITGIESCCLILISMTFVYGIIQVENWQLDQVIRIVIKLLPLTIDPSIHCLPWYLGWITIKKMTPVLVHGEMTMIKPCLGCREVNTAGSYYSWHAGVSYQRIFMFDNYWNWLSVGNKLVNKLEHKDKRLLLCLLFAESWQKNCKGAFHCVIGW